MFTVTLSAPSGRNVSVNYATIDGTAVAGQDYTATSGTLTIPAGNTSGTIAVAISGDHLPESNETFTLQLSAPVNVTVANGQATGTIVNDDILSVSLSANRSFPVAAGTAVTWTVTAGGGAPPYQYQFRVWDSTVGWRTVQMYSTTSTFTWAPAHTGTYQVEASILDAGSTAAADATVQSAQFAVTAAPAVTVSSFTADHTFPVDSGTSVTWTATANGGVAPLQYRFVVYDPWVGWISLQEWGSSNTVTWTPLHPATYDLQVWVRAAGSTAAYDAWLGSGDVGVNSMPGHLVSVTSDSQSPIAPGTVVTWKAVAAGGTAPIEYEFWLFQQSTATWTLVQTYGSSSTWTWTAPSTSDTYQVQVWVRDQGFPGQYESWMNGVATVGSGAVGTVALTSNQVAPITPGVPITWTAQASGGTAPLLYRFWLYDLDTATWTIVQDWSAARTYTWTPAAGDFGTRALQVWVKSTGAPDWQAYAGTGFFVIVP